MGAMSSRAKPWELDLTEDHSTSDEREPPYHEAKETDGLLTEKECQRHESYDLTFGMKGFLENLNQHFGHKLLWLLFASQFLLKGFTLEMIGKAEPYIFALYSVPATNMQVYQGVIRLPWAVKPIIGLVSDLVPVYGYNKAPYMLTASILGVVSLFCVGMTTEYTLALAVLVACFTVIQLQASTADLLTEAKYAERIRQIPQQGPALLSYVWSGMTVGSLFAVVLSGVVIGKLGPRAVYIIAAIPAGIILVPLALNYLEESPLSSIEVAEARQRFMAQGETIFLCALMLFATFSLMALVMLDASNSPGTIAVCAVVIALIILVGFSVTLSPMIAKVNAFALIQTSLSLSTSGAAFYFYTDTAEQYPEGPHFSPFFYNSVLGLVSAVVSLFGIYSYQRWMSQWTYRNILLVTNIAYTVISIPDIIFFMRLNVQWGLDDHVFVLGASVAQSIIFQWQWMPQVVILSNLCPRGMEATMYALLAGCHNLGNSIASYCGAWLLARLGVTPNGSVGESDKFENLWKASAVSMVLPFFVIIALFWLYPNQKQTEKLIDEDENSATAGSLWRHWTGKDLIA
jgi:folate/biopterin transporter